MLYFRYNGEGKALFPRSIYSKKRKEGVSMSEENKISKAQQKAVQKYVKNNYDRVVVTFPKGKRDIIKQYASNHGESMNAFIVRSVNETMERDPTKQPNIVHDGQPGVHL